MNRTPGSLAVRSCVEACRDRALNRIARRENEENEGSAERRRS